MGLPMSENLANAGNNVTVFDVNKSVYKKLKNKKINKIYDIQDIPADTNIVISMLPDGKSLNNVITGKNGIIGKIKENSSWIDCSSVDYDTTTKLYKLLKQKKVSLLDAPVSGGVSGAKNSSLTIMVGGDKHAFNKVHKCLLFMGKNVIYVGKSGSGQIVKACNNMMLGINMIGISEAFSLAIKFGIDKKVFYKICSNSTSSSWAMINHLPVKGLVENSAANNNFKPGYAAALIKKDLNISQAMAKKVKMKTILGKKAKNIYDKFCNNFSSNLDYSAIIKIFK